MGEQLEFADTQMAAIHLIDEITGHDQQGLAALDLAGLRAQVDARQTLYDYVDSLWEQAKAAAGYGHVYDRTTGGPRSALVHHVRTARYVLARSAHPR